MLARWASQGAPGTTSRHELAHALRVAKRTARAALSPLVGAFLSPAGAALGPTLLCCRAKPLSSLLCCLLGETRKLILLRD